MHAIIGCGRVAINHVDSVKAAGEDIYAACDILEDRGLEFVRKYGIKEFYTDYKDILNNPKISTISVCTDHASHAKITIAALNAGKHVIVEKPMALSMTDAQAMIDCAKKNNKVLAVVSQHRYDKMAVEIANLVKQGMLGNITMVSGFLQCSKNADYYTKSGWRGTIEKEGGSTLINQAIHTLDLIITMCGEPEKIYPLKTNLKFKGIIETEDTLTAVMEFENGALGTFATTNTSTIQWKSWIELVGDKGSIGFTTGFPVRLTIFNIDAPEADTIKTRLQKIENEREELPPSQSYYGISHKYQIKNFLETSKGKEKLYMSPESALPTLKTLFKMYE